MFNPDLTKQAQEVIFNGKLNKPVHPNITFNNPVHPNLITSNKIQVSQTEVYIFLIDVTQNLMFITLSYIYFKLLMILFSI